MKKIEVSLADKTPLIARLIASDASEDLAVIKIEVSRKLPVMPIGTSSDLLVGETVIAMGNAFGYDHTVSRGIVSAIHRSVQISDTQSYDDLIQTDASINPGNSGGPLMNIDGELVGINVAVRAGASGIGFAIPVDKALGIAADLLSIERLESRWHGIVGKQQNGTQAGVLVQAVERSSPAEQAGIHAGDVITKIDEQPVARMLDIERALLGGKLQESSIMLKRKDAVEHVSLTVTNRSRSPEENDIYWTTLGLKIAEAPASMFENTSTRYRGGLMVTAVRPKSPAAEQKIRKGDVLVGMHVWETAKIENVDWILNRPELADFCAD